MNDTRYNLKFIILNIYNIMPDSLLEDLLADSQTKYLKESCPSLFNSSGTPNLSYNNILSTDENIVIPDGLKYYQMVETGNNYVNDLLDEEEKFLTEKYGESLYNYFKKERKDYIDAKMKEVCSTLVSTGSSETATGGNDHATLVTALRKQLNSYRQSLITYNEVSKKEKKNTELGFLNARKFHYRTDAMEDVDKIDTAISIIYYVALISCVIYIGSQGRLNVRKNWWVYLLLILLPLMLSRIYAFVVMRLYKLKQTISEQAPRNSFLNQL